jgi:NADH dehydrogenase
VLEQRGIEVETGVLVTDAHPRRVVLSTGAVVETDSIVWSAGVRPDDPEGMPAVERSRSGRIVVDELFRLPGHDGVFVIGDLASADHEGAELPMLSPPAMQAGRHVARAILASAAGSGEAVGPFRYRDKGTMATIGRNAAVAELGRLRLKGFFAWAAWLTVHLYYIIGFRNRAAVLASWGWNYLRRDRPIRIIAHIGQDPVSDEFLADLAEPDAQTGAADRTAGGET